MIAAVTERVFGDPAMVGWSIALVCLPAFTLSALCYAIAWRNVTKGGAIALLLKGDVHPA